MNDPFELLIGNPAAAVAGIFAMGCVIASPFFNTRRDLLLAQLGIPAGFGLHYLLLGATTGAAVNAIACVQILISILGASRPQLRFYGWAMPALVVVVAAFTWKDIASTFIVAGLLLMMVGRLQTDLVRLRLFILLGGPFMAAYDLLLGSLPALVADLAGMTTGVIMLLRMTDTATGQLRSA